MAARNRAVQAMAAVGILMTIMAGAALAQTRELVSVVRPIPIYLANGKTVTNVHEVVGRVTGTSPIAVTFEGAARFTDAKSYFCVASGADNLQTLGPQVVQLDGAHLRIIHASFDPAAVTYRCVGM